MSAYEQRGELTPREGATNVYNITVEGDYITASDGGKAAGRGGAIADRGGAASTGKSAASTQGGVAASTGAKLGIRERAKGSIWTKVWAVLMIVFAIAATVLLVLDVTDIGIAGYVLAVIAILVGVIPLLGG